MLRKRLAAATGAALMVMGGAVLFTPTANATTEASKKADHKVTICHRTDSNTNPYVRITVDTDAAHGGKDKGIGDHAGVHLGPVWNPNLKAQGIKWGDIIPPYVDDQGVSFPGYNWDAAGKAIYNNKCKPVKATPSPTPSTTSPTPTPSTTSATPTPTESTPTPTSSTTPPSPTEPGTTPPASPPATSKVTPPAELPETGSSTGALGFIAAVLLAAGAGLIGISKLQPGGSHQ